MADTKKTHTYEEVKDAVFYAHQKPEALADLLAEALGVTVPERPANLVLGAKPTEEEAGERA